MSIKYKIADDIMERIYNIVKVLNEDQGHVKLSGVYAVKSYGSNAEYTLARCHALSKIWQLVLGIKAVYIIEVISERFDKMSRKEQDRVLIHEIMHIPKTFGGGFKHHDFVNEQSVEKMYQKYINLLSLYDYNEI